MNILGDIKTPEVYVVVAFILSGIISIIYYFLLGQAAVEILSNPTYHDSDCEDYGLRSDLFQLGLRSDRPIDDPDDPEVPLQDTTRSPIQNKVKRSTGAKHQKSVSFSSYEKPKHVLHGRENTSLTI